MGLRERLARLEDQVHTPRKLAAQRAVWRAIAMASEAALYTLGEVQTVAEPPAAPPPTAPPRDPNEMVAAHRDGRTVTVPRRVAESWERDSLTIVH